MKPMLSVLTLTLAGAAFILPALAADEHKVKEGPFVMRLKFPSGYQVPPHTHPKAEVVTVISGTVHVGMGETADKSKAQALAAGGFFAMPPGMQHYVWADGETVVQLNGIGPWAVTYVNPKDDPRQKSQ